MLMTVKQKLFLDGKNSSKGSINLKCVDKLSSSQSQEIMGSQVLIQDY